MAIFNRRNQDGQTAAPPDGRRAAVPFEIWHPRPWPDFDVVGESHYKPAIQTLLAQLGSPNGGEVTAPVSLVHNPHNPYDSNAIEVKGATGLLGYLSREDARRYAPVFGGLQREGYVASTTARVWGGEGEDWDDEGDAGKRVFLGSVRVVLPEPHMVVPRNYVPPVPHLIVPNGAAIQVTGEEAYLEAIAPYLTNEGGGWVFATLHEVVDSAGRTPKALAEVRIDGRTVGRLTTKMSGEVLPVVAFLAERGLQTCVRAIVKGNRIKAEVVLYTARAHELPQEWFDAITPVPGTPHTAQVPPEQPAVIDAPPPTPPDGWYPDPLGMARLRLWKDARWTPETRS